MSVMYGTGASLVGYDVVERSQRDKVAAHTTIDVEDIFDPAVRSAVISFDGALTYSSSLELDGWKIRVDSTSFEPSAGTLWSRYWFELPTTTSFTSIGLHGTEVADIASATGAVSMIGELAKELDLSIKDVLSATGVSKRTYYSWKSFPGRSPRVSSQAGVWSFAEVVDDLRDRLGPKLRQWVHSSPDRLKAVRNGDGNALVAMYWDRESDIRRYEPSAYSSGLDEDVSLPLAKEHLVVEVDGVDEVDISIRQPR